MSSELFRFVTTRAPRFRRPQLDLTILARNTRFGRSLLRDLTTPGTRERAVATADAFLAGEGFVAEPAERPLFAQLESLHARYRSVPPRSRDEALALVDDVMGQSAGALVADRSFEDARGVANDATLALKLRGNEHPGLLGRYARILQSMELIRRLATASEEIDFRRVSSGLELALRLPQEFDVPVAAAAEPGETRLDTAARPDDRATVERLSAIDRAVDELSAGADRLVRSARDPAGRVPSRLVLSESARSALSTPTRRLLEAERIDVESSGFTAALEALDGRASALRAGLAPDAEDDDPPGRVVVGSLILPSPSAGPTIPLEPGFLDPSTQPPNTIGLVKPSVGQLMVVRQQLIGYEGGELCHAENVMLRESRSRGTRRLSRTEETFTVEEERTTEKERDLQTTDRFELQSEIQSTLASAREFNVGTSVSASYGPFVQAEASTEFGTTLSSSQAESTASEFAREMTERTAARISERVRTEQTRATFEEFEETNSHGFDNTNGTGHVIGLYEWLSKRYELQVYDCGIRVLFEFTVPEPAALYLNALEAQLAKTEGVKPPKKLTVKPSGINANNYKRLAADYEADGVTPPPPLRRQIAMTFSKSSPDGNPINHTAEEVVTVPEGYRAVEARVEISVNHSWPPLADKPEPATFNQIFWDSNRVTVLVADHPLVRSQGPISADDDEPLVADLNYPAGDLPVAVNAETIVSFAATVTIDCARGPTAIAQWQLATYEALSRAQEAREADYREQLAALAAQRGVIPQGRNPAMNRIIERNEMKRLAIMMLTGQRFKSTSLPLSPQAAEFDFARALRTGRYAQFWESAIDWLNLSYVFLPYYWARQTTWGRLLTEDTDPIHAQFVSAGAATVRVAVMPQFEAAVLHFFETGEIWAGGDLPSVTRQDFVAFLDEIEERRPDPSDPGVAESFGAPSANEVPVGQPWQITLPTTLVRLRPDATLPQWERELDGTWHLVEPDNP